jgi:acetylglutamate kinase
LAELRQSLTTHKVVLLRPQGGFTLGASPPREYLRDRSLGNRLSLVSLRHDYERLTQPGALEEQDARLLKALHKFLPTGTEQAVVSVASPLNLLRELFNVKGAGTLIRVGSEIAQTDNYGTVDTERLAELLESTFGKRLVGDLFQRPVERIYYEEGLRGVAVVEPSSLAPFLSKFAVNRLAQGEGIGRDLWEAVNRDHQRLFWRARPDNPITPWYMGHCDGMTVTPKWRVYWRGLDSGEIQAAIDEAISKPSDFD